MNNRLVIAAFLALCCVPATILARQPNVIVIVADDLGYGDLGIHGCKDIPTPHIDSIAKNGIRCTNGYVSGPYCSPTRAGLLTGRYQQRFGHEFNPGPPGPKNAEVGLSPREMTLPDRLRGDGYLTGMVGKWHLGYGEEFHPLNRGFQSYYGFLEGSHRYLPAQDQPLTMQRGRKQVPESDYLTDAFSREAVHYVKEHHEDPFFLYLAFNAVHMPLQASPKYLDRFASIADTKRRTYAAMLSAMDDAIGAVLGELRENNLEQDSLIFFISDNGGPAINASSNGPLRGHKATTWEGGVRVPFFVQWKGTLPAGVTYDQPVIQLDIVPTAMAAAGVDVTPEMKLDGVNLLPHFAGSATTPPHEHLYWRFGQQMAIRAGDWKLTKARGLETSALYNLASDVGEKKDLAQEFPDKLKDLQSAWDAWNQQLVKPAWPAPQTAASNEDHASVDPGQQSGVKKKANAEQKAGTKKKRRTAP
jgi:arylsulfatase A-like enzyme